MKFLILRSLKSGRLTSLCVTARPDFSESSLVKSFLGASRIGFFCFCILGLPFEELLGYEGLCNIGVSQK